MLDGGTRAEAVASKLHKVIVLASVGIVGSHLSGLAPGRFIVARESQLARQKRVHERESRSAEHELMTSPDRFDFTPTEANIVESPLVELPQGANGLPLATPTLIGLPH
jgi:hypothetical protein